MQFSRKNAENVYHFQKAEGNGRRNLHHRIIYQNHLNHPNPHNLQPLTKMLSTRLLNVCHWDLLIDQTNGLLSLTGAGQGGIIPGPTEHLDMTTGYFSV